MFSIVRHNGFERFTLTEMTLKLILHCVSKKGATFIFAITLANVYRF